MAKERKKSEKGMKDSCADKTCPIHGDLKVRGRSLRGHVTKKFGRRIVIEFERIIYLRKYERYAKKKTRVHARLPECMRDKVQVGDYVLVQECRPLSKLIHFVFLRKIRETGKEKKWKRYQQGVQKH